MIVQSLHIFDSHKLLDIKDRIEQSALLLKQSSLEDNSDNDEIPDLGWIWKDEHFLNELTYVYSLGWIMET